MTSKIGIIGSGIVGQTLANGFLPARLRGDDCDQYAGKARRAGCQDHAEGDGWLVRGRGRFGDTSSWRQRAVPPKRR